MCKFWISIILFTLCFKSAYANLITYKELVVFKTNYNSTYSLGFDITTASSVGGVQIQHLDFDGTSVLSSWDLESRNNNINSWWAWNTDERPTLISGIVGGIYRVNLFDLGGELLEVDDNFVDSNFELPLYEAPTISQQTDGYAISLAYDDDNSQYRHTLDLWDNTESNRDFYLSGLISSEQFISQIDVQQGHDYTLYHGVNHDTNQNGLNIAHRTISATSFTAPAMAVSEPSILLLLLCSLSFVLYRRK